MSAIQIGELLYYGLTNHIIPIGNNGTQPSTARRAVHDGTLFHLSKTGHPPKVGAGATYASITLHLVSSVIFCEIMFHMLHVFIVYIRHLRHYSWIIYKWIHVDSMVKPSTHYWPNFVLWRIPGVALCRSQLSKVALVKVCCACIGWEKSSGFTLQSNVKQLQKLINGCFRYLRTCFLFGGISFSPEAKQCNVPFECRKRAVTKNQTWTMLSIVNY